MQYYNAPTGPSLPKDYLANILRSISKKESNRSNSMIPITLEIYIIIWMKNNFSLLPTKSKDNEYNFEPVKLLHIFEYFVFIESNFCTYFN